MLHSSRALFAVIIVYGCAATQGPGSSTNTKPLPNIESLVFWVSNGLETFGKKCRQHSNYYCLESYRTPPTDYDDLDNSAPGGMNPRATKAWFNVLIKEKWQIINMIDPEDPQLCCEEQTLKYLFYGQLRKKWSPEQYMEKLTEYWDEDNKPLNFITAVYLPIVCKNLIIEVGFGPGNLTRNFNSITPGAPYVILGDREFEGYGIPGFNTAMFDYENPGATLTFHWFKHNIMCKEHLGFARTFWVVRRINPKRMLATRKEAETKKAKERKSHHAVEKNLKNPCS